MRTAHISKLRDRWMCDLFDASGARVSGCYGTSEQVDEFIALQTEETRLMMDERRVCKEPTDNATKGDTQ